MQLYNPSGDAPSIGAHREVAEAQAAYLLSARFPRDEARALEAIRVAFQRPTLAERATYEYRKGGTVVLGPSASAAAAMARAWGNLSSGWRETTRSVGPNGVPYSDIIAFAEDLQTRTRRAIGFVCEHLIDTRDGPRAVRDERETYELCANQAARRVRACILALLPEDVVEAAMEQAAVTVKARADTSPEGLEKMVEAFAEVGVTRAMLERRLQRPLASISAAQVLGLRRIFASLRDGIGIVRDFFELEPPPPAGAAVDPQTGEIAPPPSPPPAGPPGAVTRRTSRSRPAPSAALQSRAPPWPARVPVGPAMPAPTCEELSDEIVRTADESTLDAILDLARSLEPAEQDSIHQIAAARRAELRGEKNPDGGDAPGSEQR